MSAADALAIVWTFCVLATTGLPDGGAALAWALGPLLILALTRPWRVR